MHWILQENIFNEEAYDRLVQAIERLGLPYSVHKVVPFVGDLIPEPRPLTRNAICIGSYAMRHHAARHDLYPGVFDLEHFDFVEQLSHWGEHMLNWDSLVCRFEDAVFLQDHAFVRPIKDTKVFAGKVMEREEFRDWQMRICLLEHDYGDTLTKDTIIQVCSPKRIHSEHRFWIVNGRIATASTYSIGDRVTYHELPADHHLNRFVLDRIAEWQPLPAFVIDVAETINGPKIVEINTLNSCGLYACDPQRLVMALEDGFDQEEKNDEDQTRAPRR